jgi:hypothetical protein
MPDLIDAHVHAWMLKMDLVMGVTTDLDMYMWAQNIAPWREQDRKARPVWRTFVPRALRSLFPGGMARSSPTYLDGPDSQTRRGGRVSWMRLIAHGSDYIKVFYDKGPRFAAMSKRDARGNRESNARARQNGDCPRRLGAGFHRRHLFRADGLAYMPIVKMPEPGISRNADLASAKTRLKRS